jgi:hypothetical protein
LTAMALRIRIELGGISNYEFTRKTFKNCREYPKGL